MKYLFKGAAAVLITMIVSIILNVICNKHGVDLNSTVTTITLTFVAILIYHGLVRIEKKDDQR